MSPTFRLEQLTLRYRSAAVPALSDLTYDGGPGVTGLIGTNGAGKSSLLQLLAGALHPTSGSCWVPVPGKGMVAPTAPGAWRHVALMPQDATLPPSLRVRDFLAYMAWVRGVPRRGRRAACLDGLAQVDLSGEADKAVGDLSGGMKRRLLLAQAILGRPALLLLDEPTASLDPEQRARMRDLLVSLAASTDALVVSSHEVDGLAGICDRLVMLDEGRLVFSGTPEELRRRGEQLLATDATLSQFEAAFLHLRSRQWRDGRAAGGSR